MTLVKIYNVETYPLMLNANERAVISCDWTMVDERVARELTAGPSWSYDNPRQPPKRFAVKDSEA